MKKTALLVTGIVLAAAGVNAGMLDKDTKSVHVDYIWMDDAFSESASGAEVAFGVSLYDMDDAAIFYSYVENSDMQMQKLGLSVEELFPLSAIETKLVPFAGVGVGYAWLNVTDGNISANNGDEDSFIFHVEAGVKLFCTDNFALSTSGRLNISTEDQFPDDDDGLDDTKWDFALGIRWYY